MRLLGIKLADSNVLLISIDSITFLPFSYYTSRDAVAVGVLGFPFGIKFGRSPHYGLPGGVNVITGYLYFCF
jgi:hypothetical protein